MPLTCLCNSECKYIRYQWLAKEERTRARPTGDARNANPTYRMEILYGDVRRSRMISEFNQCYLHQSKALEYNRDPAEGE